MYSYKLLESSYVSVHCSVFWLLQHVELVKITNIKKNSNTFFMVKQIKQQYKWIYNRIQQTAINYDYRSK